MSYFSILPVTDSARRVKYQQCKVCGAEFASKKEARNHCGIIPQPISSVQQRPDIESLKIKHLTPQDRALREVATIARLTQMQKDEAELEKRRAQRRKWTATYMSKPGAKEKARAQAALRRQTMSDEERERRRAYQKEYRKRPDAIAREKERQRALRLNPDYRAKREAYQRDYYARPEVKARMYEAVKRYRSNFAVRLRAAAWQKEYAKRKASARQVANG